MGAVKMEKIRSGTFKHIESELYAYHDTIAEMRRIREEILHATFVIENPEGDRGNNPSDPTGRKVSLLLTHKTLLQMEEITTAIQAVYDGLPPYKQKLVHLKYWTRPQTLTWEGISQQIPISRRRCLVWRDEIVCSIADRLGWI